MTLWDGLLPALLLVLPCQAPTDFIHSLNLQMSNSVQLWPRVPGHSKTTKKQKSKLRLKKSANINVPILSYSENDYSSVQFSCSVVSDSLQPHGLQHARPPCPSPTPRVYSNSRPLSQWCHPTISSSVVPFSSCLLSFPAYSYSFPAVGPVLVKVSFH